MRGIIAVAGMAGALALAACTTTQSDLTDSQLQSLLTGQTVTFEPSGQATYAANGRYTYTGPFNGRNVVHRGRYYFASNQVCVNFDDGGRRCDRYVRRGDDYYLINARGSEFRARIGV